MTTTSPNQSPRQPRALWGIIGVIVALTAPLVQVALRPVIEGTFAYPMDRFVSLWVMWGAILFVFLMSHFVEGIPISTFGFRRSTKPLRTHLIEMIITVLVAFGLMIVIIPLSSFVREAVTGTTASTTIDPERIPPFWVMLPAWLTAAIGEEILFRSYPIERLDMLMGRRRLGAIIALMLFVVLHGFAWDWIHLLTVVLPFGAVATWLYLWRRSLLLMALFHGIVNIPILLLPILAPYL